MYDYTSKPTGMKMKQKCTNEIIQMNLVNGYELLWDCV